MTNLLRILLVIAALILWNEARGADTEILKIDSDRMVMLSDEINKSSIDEVVEHFVLIRQTDPNNKADLWLLIDSAGGNVQQGERLEMMFQEFEREGIKIECLVTGKAMSAAFYLLTACSDRFAFTHSFLMFHPYRISASSMNATEALIISKVLNARNAEGKARLVKSMQMDPTKLSRAFDAERVWSSAELIQEIASDWIKVVNGVEFIEKQ